MQSQIGVNADRGAGQCCTGLRVLFASAHSIVDFSNGASVATLDVLQGLSAEGFDCQAFCTSRLDFQQEVCLEQIVGDLRQPYQVLPSICGGERADFSSHDDTEYQSRSCGWIPAGIPSRAPRRCRTS